MNEWMNECWLDPLAQGSVLGVGLFSISSHFLSGFKGHLHAIDFNFASHPKPFYLCTPDSDVQLAIVYLHLDVKWKMSKIELLIFSPQKHLQVTVFFFKISIDGTSILPIDQAKIPEIVFDSLLSLAFTCNSSANNEIQCLCSFGFGLRNHISCLNQFNTLKHRKRLSF